MSNVEAVCCICNSKLMDYEPVEGIEEARFMLEALRYHCRKEHGDVLYDFKIFNTADCGRIYTAYEIEENNLDISDDVNHPSHYTKNGVECIDWIKEMLSEEEYRGYLKGNVLKYMWRYDSKGNPEKDLKKASKYVDFLMESIERTDAK